MEGERGLDLGLVEGEADVVEVASDSFLKDRNRVVAVNRG
jgi:hypothetical protein